MSTLQSSGLEPAIRLKSLKNANRRVMPGEEEIQNLDQFNPDIAGTANPMPAPAPTQNMPQPAIGSQVSAQSYDPRANQVMTAPPVPPAQPQPVMANPNPPPSQDPGMNEKRLGENLPAAAGIQPPPQAEEGQTPIPTPEADTQTPYGPQLPPYPLLGSGLKKFWKGLVQKGIGQSLADIPEGIANLQQEPTELDKEVAERSKKFGYETIPGWGPKPPIEEQPAAQAGQPPVSEQEAAKKAYFQYPSDEIAATPEHQEEFKKQTGIDFTPEIKQNADVGQEAKDYLENGGDKTGMSEQAQRLVDRIESNKSTDADKYMIGLALVMPLIVGGMFGKEAGFGALAGGMKGMGDVYGRRAKDTQEAEELLADINKTKATQTAAAEKANIYANSPKKQWTDKKTGTIRQGPELADGIYADDRYLSTRQQQKSAGVAVDKILESKGLIDSQDNAIQEGLDVLRQLKKEGIAKKVLNVLATNKDKRMIKELSPDVVIDGVKVNSGLKLQQLMSYWGTNFSTEQHFGQMDAANQENMKNFVSNPFSSFADPEDLEEQLLTMSKLAHFNLSRKKGTLNIDEIDQELKDRLDAMKDPRKIKIETSEAENKVYGP